MVHPNGTAAPNGTRSIYGLFWQLRGGQCNMHLDFGFQEGQADPQLRQSIACDLLLEGGNVTEVWAREPLEFCHMHAGVPSCQDTSPDLKALGTEYYLFHVLIWMLQQE